MTKDRHALGQLMRLDGLPSEFLRVGLQALGWLIDERGIAGTSETDGLSWSLPMHEIFERWVECVTRCWARQFGGQVRSAHAGETTVPLVWERGSRSSLGSLAPDIVIRNGDDVFIVDAKYKGHFEELDDQRWAEVSEQLRCEHRHDLHQVLAYAALYDAPNITSMLVYPMQQRTWQRLAVRNRTTTLASLRHGGRNLTLALSGIPLGIPAGFLPQVLIEPWNRLRDANLSGLQTV
ncbi:hypothetical protein HQ520_01505 [bacterium]|nr:hypothetical protein [bacterium]